ncbi:hypothetical protein CS022_20665 [Veronia nyctiphanis]|uniref:Outer membrane protein beta-barrel domain-containing protein n=1 Tax=Veronia nyctiphanis TaxID=1278244 RepID=A0A4Q0YQV5_9GAMM|nr:porin family protein [Veronia nyctiphanis]RXJ71509.1 hypothetical protein CS022_20665 [Veronia nyctiphanis]
MKKFVLSAAVIATSIMAQSAFAATNASNDYNFVSGGVQFSKFNNEMPTKAKKGGEFESSKKVMGGYVRGSYNFADNFFTEARVDLSKKGDAKVTDGLVGIGYYQPINNDLSLYGLAGYSAKQFKLPNKTGGKDKLKEKGLTGEIGAKYHATDSWTIEPAIRYSKYDHSAYEVKLGNTINVYKNVSLEANVSQDQFKPKGADEKTKQTKFMLGARYNF